MTERCPRCECPDVDAEQGNAYCHGCGLSFAVGWTEDEIAHHDEMHRQNPGHSSMDLMDDERDNDLLARDEERQFGIDHGMHYLP